jgi:hypothetical protein
MYDIFREMKVHCCCRVDNHVIGYMKNNIRFVIPVTRFEKKYGYIPSVKTWGSRFKDNNIIYSFNAGLISYNSIELNTDYSSLFRK